MEIRAALIEDPGEKFHIETLELAEPRENEALVRIAACGVCHTDDVARNQIIPVPLPAVFGHEGCGIVEALGPGMEDFKPGDRVLFSFGYCGTCPNCRSGHPYACLHNRRLNFSGAHFDGGHRLSRGGRSVSAFFGQGAFATYAVVHRNNLIPAPADLPLELLAPLGCGIQTGAGAVLNYLKAEEGSSILITGCGAVGLSAVMAAAIASCGTIIACDVVPERLRLARELGATHTLNAREVSDIPATVRSLTDGYGVQYAVDCTGSGKCVRTSLICVRPLGTCAVVGATQELTIHVENELMGAAKTLGGVVEGCCVPQLFIPKLLDFYRAGRFPFDRLVEYYPFEDINRAFADTKAGKVVKAVLRMD